LKTLIPAVLAELKQAFLLVKLTVLLRVPRLRVVKHKRNESGDKKRRDIDTACAGRVVAGLLNGEAAGPIEGAQLKKRKT